MRIRNIWRVGAFTLICIMVGTMSVVSGEKGVCHQHGVIDRIVDDLFVVFLADPGDIEHVIPLSSIVVIVRAPSMLADLRPENKLVEGLWGVLHFGRSDESGSIPMKFYVDDDMTNQRRSLILQKMKLLGAEETVNDALSASEDPF